MKYRTLGDSDIKVSELAFGAWAIGGWQWGGTDSKDAVKAIETAVDNGMTTIDTAAVYGFGLSEELVGKAIRGKRDKVQILTKFGLTWSEKKGEFFFSSQDNSGKDVDIYKYSSKATVISDCDQSLKRLGTDYIDLYQIHWPDQTTPVAETMEAIEYLIKKGKIRAGAVCNYSKQLMIEAGKTYRIASNQVPYSMVNRSIEDDIAPYCIKNNIGILAYSPLQRGLLTGKIKHGHVFKKGDTRPGTLYYSEPNFSRIMKLIENLSEISAGLNVTLSQLVLNWTLRQPGITCALAGARNADQVLENVITSDFILNNEDIARINKYLSDLKLETKI